MRVALVDRLDAAEAADAVGQGSRAFRCDLSDPAAIAATVDAVQAWSGGCGIFVHNAGLFPTTPLDTLTLEEWRLVFAVNLDAAILIATGLIPAMREARWGRIVMIASGTVGMGRRDVSAYIASKMGGIGLARALASDLGPFGITANAVAPGFIPTEGTTEKFEGDFEALATSIARRQAVPRLGTPEEIAASVAFLCSEDAAMITGQTWMSDGGWVRL